MPDELQATIAGGRAAHQRLFATIAGLDDEQAREPSLLTGWTRGHVLTHIARNADSHVRMLEGALRGESLTQYAGGVEQRAADIEAGSGRPAAELVDDVRVTALALEQTWARMTPQAWDGHGLMLIGEWPCRIMPFSRWREVEVHHVDLGLGYDVTDWPDDYLARELPMALADLPDRMPDPADRRRLLAWLIGRAPEPGPLHVEPWLRPRPRP